MGLRFRKSFKLAPGLRLNMSKSGFGLSVGPRGASMSFGPSGTYQNVNLPGGFSFRDRVGGTSQRHSDSRSSDSQKVSVHVSLGLEDDGTVIFKDRDGNPLSPSLQDLAKKQQGETIKVWLAKNCDEINEKLEKLDTIHVATSPPWQKPVYTPIPFTNEPPVPPYPKSLGLWGHLFPWVKRRIEMDNATAEAEYDEKLTTWRDLKTTHEKAEADRRTLLEERLYSEPEAMQMVLEQRLAGVPWPRETNIAMEIAEGGKVAILDVDLPEIEDVPRKTATYGGRGWKVTIIELSDHKVARLYMRHVHGIAFRIIGETLAALPSVQNVVMSGYSQRSNKVTGKIMDEYLYSVKVSREKWSQLYFRNLSAIDVTECLNQFELRREMSKSGRFSAVEPFSTLTLDMGPST
jgi:uncharacterized protein DUF4236